MNLKHLNPRQKRAMQVFGVAGLVLLVVMLAKRQNAGTADPTGGTAGAVTPDGAQGGAPPADFGADNTGNFADFANTWAGALGELGTGVSQLGANQAQLAEGEQGITDSLVTLGGSLAATQASVDAITSRLDTGGPFAPATDGTPSPVSRSAAAVPKTKTVLKRSAAHGGALSVYHVTPGKKPVYVRGASSAAKKKAAPKKRAAPKRKAAVRKPAPAHRSPSHKPKAAHRAPARKKARR